jgi:hypothetical protein
MRKERLKEQSILSRNKSRELDRNVTLRLSLESEIEKKISRIQAETQNKISEISNHINLAEKEANKDIATIENTIVVLKETAHAKSQRCTKS